jgi:hypothetical protein
VPPLVVVHALYVLQKMNIITRTILALFLVAALTGCSCAVFHPQWESPSRQSISNESFHEAASELGFKSHHQSNLGYKKKDVYFYYRDGSINLHSMFCPTPWTIISGGHDLRQWESRCNGAEESVNHWFASIGIQLKQTKP